MAHGVNSFPDFVIFLDAEWDEQSKRNRQHFLIAELAEQLESRSKIIGVERPICPWTSPFRRREKFIQFLNGKCRIRQKRANLFIYTPVILLHNYIATHLPYLTTLNRRLLRQLLKRVLRQLDFKTGNLMAWIHHPLQLEDIGVVGEKLLIYDCYDDYINRLRISDTLKRELARREKTILSFADVVFVSSSVLLNEKQSFCEQAIVVPNAIDAEHFLSASEDALQLPDEIENIRKPRLGYIGSLHPRLDFSLLRTIACKRPEWSIILIGPPSANLRQANLMCFEGQTNVHFLGPKSYSELPQYYKGLDVCLIPFNEQDPTIIACSPMKLYEYLATGKPIVSTHVPAVLPFDGLVRIGRNAEEFERQIEASLAERDTDLSRLRLEAAKNNSWKKRVETILETIETILRARLS